MSSAISEAELRRMYQDKGFSAAEIARILHCSEGKINYWLRKYKLEKRSISDALYKKLNPHGDPFLVSEINSFDDAFMLGLGIGLFWGEGNKKDRCSLRLGNSDPDLMRIFLHFLEHRYQIQKHRLRFGLQIFSDMDPVRVEQFWADHLMIGPELLYKTVVTVSGKVGSYKEKTRFGVLTLYFHNRKLRDQIVGEIDKLRNIDYHSDVLL